MEVEIVPRTFHISSRLVSLVVRVQRLKRKKKKKKKIKNRNGVYFLPAGKVHLWCTRWDADAYRKSLLCAVFAIIWNIEISFWKGVFSFSDGKKKKKNERKIVPSIPPFKFKRGFKFQIVPRERISEIRNSTMECEFRPCFVLIAIGTPVSLNRERRRRNDKRGTQGFRTLVTRARCIMQTLDLVNIAPCSWSTFRARAEPTGQMQLETRIDTSGSDVWRTKRVVL